MIAKHLSIRHASVVGLISCACMYVCQLRAMCTLHVKSHPQILMTYTYAIHMPIQQASWCLKTVHTSTFIAIRQVVPQKLEHPITTQVYDLCIPCTWMFSCCTVHSDDKPVSSMYLHGSSDVFNCSKQRGTIFLQMTPRRMFNQ